MCADSLKDKNSKLCPGGLTDNQWDKIEYAANNKMTKEARELVLGLLHRGKISPEKGLIAREDAAGIGSPLTGKVRLDVDAFKYKTGDFAFLLVHEAKHTTQLFGSFVAPWKREADADAFGCANTWGRDGYFGGAYRSTLGPCGSGQ